MDTNARIAESRLAIAAANPGLDYERIDELARRFVEDEQEAAALAQMRAAAAVQLEQEDAARRRQGAVLLGLVPATGPSADELLAELAGLQARGEGW